MCSPHFTLEMIDPQWSSTEQCQSHGEEKKSSPTMDSGNPQHVLILLLYDHQPITINYQLHPQIFDGFLTPVKTIVSQNKMILNQPSFILHEITAVFHSFGG